MFCCKCGKSINFDDVYCRFCGVAVNRDIINLAPSVNGANQSENRLPYTVKSAFWRNILKAFFHCCYAH